MKLRTAVLMVAGLGIPLSLLVMLLPITWGYGGYNWIPGPIPRVAFVDPSGPAARAGLRVGDGVVPLRGNDAITELAGSAGVIVHERIIRDGRIRVIDIPFVRFFGSLAAQELFSKILMGLTAAGAFLVAILVMIRARDVRVGTRAAIVLLLAGFGAFCQAAALVCGSPWPAFVFEVLLPPIVVGAGVWAALSLLAIYPPDRPALRRALAHAGIAALAWGFVQAWLQFNGAWYGAWSALAQPSLASSVDLVFQAVMAMAAIDAMAKAGATYAAPTRWLGGMWLLGIMFAAWSDVSAVGFQQGGQHSADIFHAANVFCFAFGLAYPVLRHRLVDLNILVSRATVFGVVSTIIVGVFIAAEWAIGKIFEASVGLSNDRQSLAAQIATLGVVLLLGISARSIHRFVDERTTKTFFGKRIKGLSEIERVAREADVSTDAQAVMDLAVATIIRCLQPLGAAFYLRAGGCYERASVCGTVQFQAAYAFNDAAPLRLRRWQEPFEVDDDSDARHHMLFIPMALRGELLGFLCCGPKPDRTTYLADEIRALLLLAHQTGIAAAWLGRMPPAAVPPPLTVSTL